MINKKVLKKYSDKYMLVLDILIMYCLALYYKLNIVFPINYREALKEIYDFEKKEFKVPLFKEYTDWNWINDYIKKFIEVNPKKRGNKIAVEKRLKWFIKQYEVSKKEIMEATDLYLQETNPKYIREPHYFIKKGRGSDFISDLYTYILIIRDNKAVKTKNLTIQT